VASRFLRWFGWISGGLIVFVALVNFFIDPHYRFGMNQIGVYISSEREFKATAVQKKPHDALVIGNSKPSIIDPKEVEGYTFLNVGFAGAKPEEIYWFLERFAHDEKLVVLGLDYGMFNEGAAPMRSDPFERPLLADICNYLLNLTSFQYAMEALFRKAVGQEPTILPTGQSNPKPYLDFDAQLTEEHYEPALDLLKRDTFNDFDYSVGRLDYLRKIKRLLAERGIRLVVFINPEHEVVLDLIRSMPAGEQFDDWKEDLREIFPDLIDLTAVESLQEREHYYLHDPYHYKPKTGTMIMRDYILPQGQRGQ